MVFREKADGRYIGTGVVIPFGKGNREITGGYVIGISKQCEYDPKKVKPILRVAEKSVAIVGKPGRTCGVDERALWRNNDSVIKDGSAD